MFFVNDDRFGPIKIKITFLIFSPWSGKLKNMLENRTLLVIEHNVFSLHHSFSCLESFFGKVGSKARCTSPTITRDEITREATPEDIGTYSYNRASIEHRIDATFAMVAHHQATESQSGLREPFGGVIPQSDLCIVVLQV